VTVAYFDASALVKLVVEEAGSEDVAALWDGADIVAASRVAYVEVNVALAAAHRAHRLHADAHRAAKRAWEEYRSALQIVELTPDLTLTAADLAEQHSLGALDAIHLASATLFADVSTIMATWDARLLAAARSVGIATLPAS
jgi:predicted nucleic acid-binding protein